MHKNYCVYSLLWGFLNLFYHQIHLYCVHTLLRALGFDLCKNGALLRSRPSFCTLPIWGVFAPRAGSASAILYVYEPKAGSASSILRTPRATALLIPVRRNRPLRCDLCLEVVLHEVVQCLNMGQWCPTSHNEPSCYSSLWTWY